MTFQQAVYKVACNICKQEGLSTECDCVLSKTWSRICPTCNYAVYEVNHIVATTCHNCGTPINLYKEEATP